MEMTQRGRLSEGDKGEIDSWAVSVRMAEETLAQYRRAMVEMVGRSSFREVSDATGISTTTLQRWKRELGN